VSLPRWDRNQLEAEVASGSTVIVDLRADWCPQCGPQERVVQRVVAEHPGVRAGSIDVEEEPEIVEEFEVSGLPTLLIFRDGAIGEVLRGFSGAPLIRRAL
jgi:thioredoxin 1